jgi:hypothetical protein
MKRIRSAPHPAHLPHADKTCRAIADGYEMNGWRERGDGSWHIMVSPVGRPNRWIGYTVTAGIFEVTMVAQAHREAVLRVIYQWERSDLPVPLSKTAGPIRIK